MLPYHFLCIQKKWLYTHCPFFILIFFWLYVCFIPFIQCIPKSCPHPTSSVPFSIYYTYPISQLSLYISHKLPPLGMPQVGVRELFGSEEGSPTLSSAMQGPWWVFEHIRRGDPSWNKHSEVSEDQGCEDDTTAYPLPKHLLRYAPFSHLSYSTGNNPTTQDFTESGTVDISGPLEAVTPL